MRIEIRPSASTGTTSVVPWIWRVWEHGRLLARGESSSREEAEKDLSVYVGKEAQTGGQPSRWGI